MKILILGIIYILATTSLVHSQSLADTIRTREDLINGNVATVNYEGKNILVSIGGVDTQFKSKNGKNKFYLQKSCLFASEALISFLKKKNDYIIIGSALKIGEWDLNNSHLCAIGVIIDD